jgi:hypothetical protein
MPPVGMQHAGAGLSALQASKQAMLRWLWLGVPVAYLAFLCNGGWARHAAWEHVLLATASVMCMVALMALGAPPARYWDDVASGSHWGDRTTRRACGP